MSFDFESRSVGFRGFSVAFLLLLTLVGCDCIDVNVTATVGNAADLPCTCPPDQPPYLVWQKNVDGKKLLVNYHKNNNENYEIALEFQNRTELKRSGDSCFLVFHNVRPSDEGLYFCYYGVSPLRCNNTYLEVTAKDRSAGHQDVQNTAVISAVCACLIVVMVVVALYVGVACKNRHQMNIGSDTKRDNETPEGVERMNHIAKVWRKLMEHSLQHRLEDLTAVNNTEISIA